MCACQVYEPSLLWRADRGARAATAGAPASQQVHGAVRIEPECTGNGPMCVRANAATSCADGVCHLLSCQGSFADCDQRPDNGCEADLSSPANCGRCDVRCSFSHGMSSCRDGKCVLLGCQPEFANCDGVAANGCESALDSTANCGACGRTCPADLPQATALCQAGQCQLQCDPGYGDCNGRAEDGCEQRLTAAGTCGACTALACVGPNVTLADCQDGPCAIMNCSNGFEDCNGVIQDGCEADLTTVQSCGGCAARCSLPHVAAARCEVESGGGAAQCVIDRRCREDELDCSVTRQRGCDEGYADCDGITENGCETDLRRLDHCGRCGNSCVSQRENSECHEGLCVSTGCAPGYARCAGMGECRSLQDDVQNCGECGRSCPASTPYCAGGHCTTLACSAGSADCNGDATDHCESSLNTLDHCGGCDSHCDSLPNAHSVICQDQDCQISSCDKGFADCDQDPKNGCEVSLNTDDDCGGCGSACHFPQALARCEDRKCTLVGCMEGRGDCNASPDDGCEDELRSTENCGRCGLSCNALPHVAAGSCKGGTCELSCEPGFADCDGLPDNGCEADLTLAPSCGTCANDCSRLTNVAAADCSEGRCVELTCSAGFGDCNDDPTDGCERPLNTLEDCGECQMRCELPNALADCSAGVCTKQSCDIGYGDCDGEAESGCESPLDSPNHCGGCGIACADGAPCINGKCGCASEAQCQPGESCCNNQCLNTVGECFPFPCLPGTARSENSANCGGCGQECLFFCCGPLF